MSDLEGLEIVGVKKANRYHGGVYDVDIRYWGKDKLIQTSILVEPDMDTELSAAYRVLFQQDRPTTLWERLLEIDVYSVGDLIRKKLGFK